MRLINYDKARELVKSEKDIGLQQFMARALTIAVRRSVEIRTTEEEFDMLVLIGIIKDLYRQKENLVKVLSGEDLRWWTIEES
jgi:hypothetical protein